MAPSNIQMVDLVCLVCGLMSQTTAMVMSRRGQMVDTGDRRQSNISNSFPKHRLSSGGGMLMQFSVFQAWGELLLKVMH